MTTNPVGKENCHPLREDVSWNGNSYDLNDKENGHPLREDVSWNNKMTVSSTEKVKVILFVRMWVEMCSHIWLLFLCVVILFVRMWVEINTIFKLHRFKIPSSSSWGCELKYQVFPAPQVVYRSSSSWGCELKYDGVLSTILTVRVILFVRMWVEIITPIQSLL